MAETIKKFSTDYSLLEVRPDIVVVPKNVDDIKKIVKFVSVHQNDKEYQVTSSRDQGDRFGLSLTARSAGTDMTGGPLNHGIILDFMKYFTEIGTVIPSADYETGTVTVGPGVF